MLKRVCCLFLSLVLSVSLFVVPATANSAVGTIIAGAGGAAGLGLSASTVVPVIGAAFGIGIVVENRDEICRDIKDTIDYIARGYGIADAYLDEFWGKCWDGFIDTSSAVWQACKGWAADTYSKLYDIATGSFSAVAAGPYYALHNGGTPIGTISDFSLSTVPAGKSMYLARFRGLLPDGSYTDAVCKMFVPAMVVDFFSFDLRADDGTVSTFCSQGKVSDDGFCFFTANSEWGAASLGDVISLPISSDGYVWGNLDKAILDYLLGVSSFDVLSYDSVGPLGDIYTDNKDVFGQDIADPPNPDVVIPGRYGVNKKDGALDLHGLAGDYGGTYTGGKTWDGAGGALDSALKDLLTGGLSWDQFMERIGAVPHIATDVPLVDADGKVLTDEAGKVLTKEKDVAIEGDKVTDKDITDTINPPKDDPKPETGGGDSAPYVVDLRDFFPFCIPFDVYDMLAILAAEPVAPKVDWVFNFGKFGSYTFAVDLAKFDTVARLLRDFELLAFCIGLAMATKKLILNGGAG